MHYIVDGYNLFFRIENQVLPLDQKRETFIESLSYEISTLKLNVTLIFDSGMTHQESFPTKKQLEGLEVIFSPQGLSADEYILELLDYQKSHTETIVTSDRELAQKVKFLGGKTQTIESFLKMILHKQKKTHSREEKKHIQESDANIARLLHIFEKKLREETSD